MMSTGGPQKGKLEFELNIVPVIDCLTILVTFMLAAGVYYSIAMLDIRLSAGGKEKDLAAKEPAVSIGLDLHTDQSVTLKLSGRESRSLAIPGKDGHVDTRTIGRELASVRERFTDVKSATLTSSKEASYQDMVSVLDVLRKSHPDVLLGGF
jgi:biopolymer transport protein TolR